MSMVSTRAFVIDAYHGIALIPFCDFFNHSSARPHTSLLSSEYVCPVCGSLPVCVHDSADMAPSDDMPSTLYTGNGTPERLAHLSMERIKQLAFESNSVDMRAERAIAKGQEIYSCYEEGIGDGKLLVEWGFVEGNGVDGMIWSPRDVFAGEEGGQVIGMFVKIVQRGEVRSVIASTRLPDGGSTRLIGPSTEGRPGQLMLTSKGEVSIDLLVAVYLLTTGSDRRLDTIEEIENGIVELAEHIDSRSTTTQSSPGGTATARVVQEAIQSLFTARLDTMYRPDLTANTMKQVLAVSTCISLGHFEANHRQDLPPDAELQRMGMTLALQERELLERAYGRWTDRAVELTRST